MTPFEIIAITLSIIVGLSMSHLLWSVLALVRARSEIRLHWMPLTWALFAFLLQIQFWVAILGVDNFIGEWSWAWYLNTLFLGVLLFACSALVIPSSSEAKAATLVEDFQRKGRYGLVPLSLYFLWWIPTNIQMTETILTRANYINVGLILLIVAAFYSKQKLIQSFATIGAFLLFVWAMLFVWASSVFPN